MRDAFRAHELNISAVQEFCLFRATATLESVRVEEVERFKLQYPEILCDLSKVQR